MSCLETLDFRWQNKKVSLGTCSYEKTNSLSKWYVELNDEEELRDTILHEIAHALSYDKTWEKRKRSWFIMERNLQRNRGNTKSL
jgi:predicted SprT family Zn-dependent metalloprotease